LIVLSKTHARSAPGLAAEGAEHALRHLVRQLMSSSGLPFKAPV